MRIAVVSDIHGNLTALEAVLADLRQTSPDVVFHGGDLSDNGSSPVEVVDRLRDLGWQGVVGNTDEMVFRPESLIEYASKSPNLQPVVPMIEEMAAWTRAALGDERIAWLRSLPRTQVHDRLALVHASPESPWRSPGVEASDGELETVYSPLGKPVAAYGHIHVPFVRSAVGMTIVNCGSVSLSYDGDRRAAYLLVDDSGPQIRRVEYDMDQELKMLLGCGLPHATWVAKALESARPQMP